MIEIKFAENLKALRESVGLTQAGLAKLLDVNQRTVSAWEKKVCEPDLKSLAKLCEIFNEDFNSILA